MERSELEQFEKKLQDAAHRKLDVWMGYLRLMKRSDEIIIAYCKYLNAPYGVSRSTRIKWKEAALQCLQLEKNVTEFKRQCRLIVNLKVDEVVGQSLPDYDRIDVVWSHVVQNAFRWLTFEELDQLINVKNGKTLAALNLVAALYAAVENSDTRGFDLLHDRFLTTNTSNVVNIKAQSYRFSHQDWKNAKINFETNFEINPRSAFKLAKLEFIALGSTRIRDPIVFESWALLGYFASSNASMTKRLIEDSSEDLRAAIANIVVHADRTLACLNRRLPRVLVEMVLQYLI